MSDRSKKIPEIYTLNPVAAIANVDLFVVEKYSNSTVSTTGAVTSNTMFKYMTNRIMGPYTNDTAANTAGIAIKELYYDSAGAVKIRLT